MTKLIPIAAAAALFAAVSALAQEAPDPATLYELSASMAASKVVAGVPATLVISVKAKPGNHISEEAPLRIDLSGVNAAPAKATLRLADSVVKQDAGTEIAEVRFEVPYATVQAGPAQAGAKAVIFVCTESLCLRDTKDLSVPFEVTPKKASKGASTSKPL
jgi:hypothetical protein